MKRIIGNLSLKAKIIMITVIVSLIPAVLITVSSYRITTSDLYDQKAQNTYTNLSSINQSVNSMVNLRRISALRLLRNPQIMGALRDKQETDDSESISYTIERFFNEYQNTSGVQSIALAGVAGCYWNGGMLPPSQEAMEAELRQCIDRDIKETFWNTPEKNGDVWVIRYMMPVTDTSTGDVIGLLTISFLEEELEKIYSYYETETDHVLVLNSNGKVMSAKDKSLINTSYEEFLSFINTDTIAGNHGTSTVKLEDETVLFSYILNEPNQFWITDVGSLKSIADARKKIAQTFLAAVGVSLFIVLTLSVFLSNNLTRPVNKIVSAISSMDIQNIETRVGLQYKDEIGVIGNALDEMSAKLRDSSDRLMEEQRAKQEAEVQMLMQQINPHFLYNTLTTVIWMIQCDQKAESIEVIKALSTLFKLGVNKGKEETTLGDEFRYVSSYLKIQEVRYRNEFTTETHIPEALEKCRVVKLILQPIVENAIYHGVYSEEQPGKIVITAKEEESGLLLTVANTPLSLSDEEVDRINAALANEEDDTFGVGLKNVNKIIRLSYGQQYGVQMHNENGYTEAQIRIPKLEQQEEEN